MGRAEDRALKKKGLTDRDIQAIKLENEYQRGVRDGMHAQAEVTYYMTAYTINYKLGFGNKRLTKIMYYIWENLDSYRTGQLNSGDFQEIKKEMNKLGVKMVK